MLKKFWWILKNSMDGRWFLCHAPAHSPSLQQTRVEPDSSWPGLPPSWCLTLQGFIFPLFLLPCIMKMRSSCEPCRSQIGLYVLLPLLTTNSLPGSGQFPLCCYNLFGFQVPHQIKNNCLAVEPSGVGTQTGMLHLPVPLRGPLSGEEPSSWEGKALW